MTDQTLSDKDKSMWRYVKLLIMDKILLMRDDHLKKWNRRLKEMGDKTKPFGGFSVIFAGDFPPTQAVWFIRESTSFFHARPLMFRTTQSKQISFLIMIIDSERTQTMAR